MDVIIQKYPLWSMLIIPLFVCLNLKFAAMKLQQRMVDLKRQYQDGYGLAFKEGLAKIDIKKA